MILFTENHLGDRRSWILNSYHDMMELFKLFPQTEEIASTTENYRDAVYEIAKYLDSHNMSAWVESDREMSKSVKNLGLALGIAASSLAGPQAVPMQHPSAYMQESNKPAKVDDFGKHPMDRFLWNLMQIESSGAKNVEHQPIKHGASKGERAIGRWGLLKNTIIEFNRRAKAHGTLHPDQEALEKYSRDKIAETFKKNPQLELNIARQVASFVHKRQKGNMHAAAYAWNTGHNLHPDEIPENISDTSDYVSKFKAFDAKNPYKPKARHIASIHKSEPDYKGRFKNWFDKRMEQARHPAPKDTTHVPDPGRIREPELDKLPVTDRNDTVEYLKQKIQDGKEQIKDGKQRVRI
jgi:hypothetical protein